VGHAEKADLLAGALALLFPVRGLEACPLVLIESMACGTPVLALGRGPVPEIVEQGVGGLLVAGVDELAAAAGRIGNLDRAAVRRLAAERFDASRMVDDYLAVYAGLG
jgi:glycosyltransferase involved in cell wall biosynthesis